MSDRNETLQAIFENLNTMQRSMQRHFHRVFEDLGLAPSQIQLLITIAHKQRTSHKQLAEAMHLTPGAITQLLEGLVACDYIVRQPDEYDRRITYILLSEAGHKKIAEIKKLRKRLLADALTSLNDRELESFRQIQTKMLAYFNEQPKQ